MSKYEACSRIKQWSLKYEFKFVFISLSNKLVFNSLKNKRWLKYDSHFEIIALSELFWFLSNFLPYEIKL